MAFSSLKGCHVVLVGNPGVGKSTILNSIIGRAEFQSGISFGHGLTDALNTRVINDVTFSDTPGLDDVDIREKAAEEISMALRKGGKTKLIFVVTTEDGRVRTVDLFTLKVILEAVEKAGVNANNAFSIMVNKCDDEFLEMLEQDEVGRKRFEKILGRVKDVNFIGYMEVDKAAKGKSNVLLSPNSKYVNFVVRAPYFVLPEENHIRLDVKRWEERFLDFARKLKVIIADVMGEIRDGIGGILQTVWMILK